MRFKHADSRGVKHRCENPPGPSDTPTWIHISQQIVPKIVYML